jgi:hypothetical protein
VLVPSTSSASARSWPCWRCTRSSFGVGQSAISVAIAVYGLARFLVAVPAGQLADRAGRRGVLALGGLVTAAGNLLCAYAPTYALFIGGRFVAGAGASLVLIGGTIVLADITTPANRGRTMAIYQGVFLFAVGVGPVPGGLLAERFGLAAPFLVYDRQRRRRGRRVAGHPGDARRTRQQRRDRRRRAAGVRDPCVCSTGRIGRAGHAGVVHGRGRADGRALQRDSVLARDRLGLSADRIGVGLAVASLVGLVLIYPARGARGPLRP